jgi:CMP/dCMP kinase
VKDTAAPAPRDVTSQAQWGQSDDAGPAGAQPGGLVIAVDGPSGSGKSSAARGVASALGLRYLDTGAMYRAVTWWLLEHEVDLTDQTAIASAGLALAIEVGTDPAIQFTAVNGVEVTGQIRLREVSNAVSQVASVPQIRNHLIAMMQQIIGEAELTAGGIVAEGRDIGTVVAPGAAVKVFLTASEQARAQRRAAELAGQPVASGPAGSEPSGQLPGADLTKREQARRDRLDAPQTQRAADAVEIDATSLGLAEVIGQILALANATSAAAATEAKRASS